MQKVSHETRPIKVYGIPYQVYGPDIYKSQPNSGSTNVFW